MKSWRIKNNSSQEEELVRFGAHGIRSASGTPGGDPHGAVGCVGLQPGGEFGLGRFVLWVAAGVPEWTR